MPETPVVTADRPLAASSEKPASEPAALPGQTSVDAGLIDETVADINAAMDRGGLATMRVVAAILLDKMFRDEAGRFFDHADSHVSYQALAQHPNLNASKSALWYAVAIEDNFRVLGAAAAGLGLSHHKRLAHVSALETRRALAELVVRDALSVVALEQLIAQTQPVRPADAPRLGRPPQPAPVKRFHQVDRAIASLQSESLGAIGVDTAAELLARAEASQLALTTWIEALRQRVDGGDAAQ